MELLNQLDGFDHLGKVKMNMETSRPDILDPTFLRPGRLDRKIEIPLPNEQSRIEILKIYATGINKHGEISYEDSIKLAEGFNGDDMRDILYNPHPSVICLDATKLFGLNYFSSNLHHVGFLCFREREMQFISGMITVISHCGQDQNSDWHPAEAALYCI
ncbi:26S proteasome regulatory subunit 10B homolog A-like [Capsicum annuum]|uniref:26S proteasome regulatory subunit 10B homolog A-like n=1 Tax=Capsicum annuum TaxID=4072 RepID=UPI001FB155E8|nr:26S proteasome regulatory subunit 10B homolog A-like [Capsicum annuum]